MKAKCVHAADCSEISQLPANCCRPWLAFLCTAPGKPRRLLVTHFAQVEVIVHCAANTGFHVPLDEIMATNVGGWQQVLEIARGCRRLKV